MSVCIYLPYLVRAAISIKFLLIKNALKWATFEKNTFEIKNIVVIDINVLRFLLVVKL